MTIFAEYLKYCFFRYSIHYQLLLTVHLIKGDYDIQD